MVRIKTNGKVAPKKSHEERPGIASRLFAQRAKVLVVLSVVMLLGWGMHGLWQQFAPQIIQREEYLLNEERITISELPEWIVGDVRGEAIRNAGLVGRLSVLDDAFAQVVEDAFLLHPWVESVDRIIKRHPAGVHVELTYRRPVAVVELVNQNVVQLVPIDRHGVHLPVLEVPNIRKRYLPRIGGIVERPPVGQPWSDPRVLGAAAIAVQLTTVWDTFHLVDILPSARPEIRGQSRYFVYDLITRGGTRVVWGAAPNAAPAGEDEFTAKLERLRRCAAKYGSLGTVRGPKVIDVRTELAVQLREVRREKVEAPKTVQKPSGREEDDKIVK